MKSATITKDWTAIEADYRAGLMSLRAIAAKAGNLTEGAIRKRARKLDWSRDLTARIRAKADEMVRTATVRSITPQYATASEADEIAIVDDNAQVLAHVQLAQRRHILKARAILVALFSELERAADDRSVELIRDPQMLPVSREHVSGATGGGGATGNGGLSLPARAATAKSLVSALRTVVQLERTAWGMDADRPAPSDDGRVIDSSKLTWEERQQLRSMIMKVNGDAATAITDQSHA